MALREGTPHKKLKVLKEEIFADFHRSKLEQLTEGLAVLNNGLASYGVGVLKIKVCDALCSKCFPVATCFCEQLIVPGKRISVAEPEGFSLRGIFQYGFKILDAFIESPQKLPRMKGARLAFRKLLEFLSDLGPAETALAKGQNVTSDTDWTAIVAHHLLSKLALSPVYTLDHTNFRKWGFKDLSCPCGCNETLSGDYGDTSLGVPSYWHGRVDILMDVAVTVAKSEPDSTGAGNCFCVEMKTTSDKMAACKEQIRAEAIVFSFLQKKFHPELDNFLIPTIAMSKEHVAVCLYDCENDIFLETPRFTLFRSDKFLKIETIITLWLVLNYRYCCSGVPKEIMETHFTADFFKHTGEQLEKYNNDVKAPCSFLSDNTWTGVRTVRDVEEILDDINDICESS